MRTNDTPAVLASRAKICASLIGLILLLAGPVYAQSYTIMPQPFGTVSDASGNIVVGGCVWTYAAGTTSPIATYSNNSGSINANPIIAGVDGWFTAYLLAGTNYKFVYENVPCSSILHGAVLRTADNIAGVPSAAATVDITGLAGETLTAGQCAYLSTGAGSKTPGQWYRCDSANTYSSTVPEIGLVPATIASGSSGTIRQAGAVPGLTSLSVAEYFVGTTGALTATAPANARHVGTADTATSLIVSGDPRPMTPTLTSQTCGRLTLTTATPITSADVTAATTLFYTPLTSCNQFTVWTGTQLVTETLTETSVAVPATTSQMYDVFAFDNAGAVNIEVLAWTNDTTRATAISLQNGFLCKAATPARRYVGSFRTTTVSGQTEDSAAKRYVWNLYNRVPRVLQRTTTGSWTYTSATIRQANATAANQVEVVVGVAEVTIDLRLTVVVSNAGTGGAAFTSVGIGEDSTTTYTGLNNAANEDNAGDIHPIGAMVLKMPAIGRHVYSWNEAGDGANTSSYFGNSASSQSGMLGRIDG